MKKIILSLATLALLASCQNELYRDNAKEYTSKQGAYVSNASAQVFVESGAPGSEVRELTLSLSRKPEAATTVAVATGQQAVLDEYNKKFGTNYQLLPTDLYEAPSEVTFPANTATVSYPVKLKSVTFPPGVVYALPVTITDDCAIPGQETAVMTVDALTRTKVARFRGSGASSNTFWPDVYKTKTWTMEAMIRRSRYTANNQSVMGTSATPNHPVDEIFIRFGDVTIDPDQLQLKTASSNIDVPKSAFAAKANEWYMLSFVYDGTTNFIYVNGRLVAAEVKRENNEYGFKGVWLGGVNEYIREFRFYNTAKTAQQIASGVWKMADPTDPNLLVYYPLNGKKRDFATGEITEDETAIWDWSKNGFNLNKPNGLTFDNDASGEPFVFPVGAR